MSTPPVEREVRQLDNDVQSIYEMLAGIQGTQRRHGNRLEEIDATAVTWMAMSRTSTPTSPGWTAV